MAAVELFTFENSLLCINKYKSNKIQMGLTTSLIQRSKWTFRKLLKCSMKRVNRSPPQLFDFYSNNILLCVCKQNILLNSLMGQDSSNQRPAFDSRGSFFIFRDFFHLAFYKIGSLRACSRAAFTLAKTNSLSSIYLRMTEKSFRSAPEAAWVGVFQSRTGQLTSKVGGSW